MLVGRAKAAGWWNQGENANDVFYNQLHSIDLRLGANPGAVGVMWHPAQGTSVRDMAIDAHGAYSGVDYGSATGYAHLNGTTDGGGGGTLEDLRITAGRYGVRGGGTNWCFRTLRVANASVAGLHLNTGSWNNGFLDVEVSGCPVAVNLSQHNNNVVMLDSRFKLPAGGVGLKLYGVNPNATGIVLSRVVASGGDWAVRGPTEATSVKQAASGSTSFKAWRSGGYEFVDDKEQLAVFGPLTPARADAPLPQRKLPPTNVAGIWVAFFQECQ